jgi:hypothetical protein
LVSAQVVGAGLLRRIQGRPGALRAAPFPRCAAAHTPATLARWPALFAGALRAPWVLSPGTTGFDLMITLRARDRERLFTPHEPVPPARISTLEQDLNWSRPPTAE